MLDSCTRLVESAPPLSKPILIFTCSVFKVFAPALGALPDPDFFQDYVFRQVFEVLEDVFCNVFGCGVAYFIEVVEKTMVKFIGYFAQLFF